MKGVDVFERGDELITRIEFNSRVPLDIVKTILRDTDRWGDIFKGLVSYAEMAEDEKHLTIGIKGMLNFDWTINTTFSFEEDPSDGSVMVTGQNEDGDWSSLRYTLHVCPSTKPNRFSFISLTCSSTKSSVPIPLSTYRLGLGLSKPIMKNALKSARRHYEALPQAQNC